MYNLTNDLILAWQPCHDGAIPGMYLSPLSVDAGTNNRHIVGPLRSTLFRDK